jgi:hypothetical protein
MLTANTLQLSNGRFGHWEVAGRPYYNKLSAILAAVPHGWWPHWNFREDEFSSTDWSIEPAETLEQLYFKRARRLREKYSSIAVEFTGGADSWNTVWSFLKQGLHIDTVYHKYVAAGDNGNANDRSAENTSAEGVLQAYPWYKKFLELDPNMRWEVDYTTDEIVSGWQGQQLDPLLFNHIHPGYIIKVPGVARELPRFIDHNQRSAVLYGIDKPNLFFENNKFYFYFADFQIHTRAFYERSALNLPADDVLFYWDPDCVDLCIKQAHIVANWFRQNPKFLYLISNRGHRDTKLYHYIVNQLIYPEYRPDWQSEKASGFYFPTHESWFYQNCENTAHGANYMSSIKRASDLLVDAYRLAPENTQQYLRWENGYARPDDSWGKLFYIGDL